MNEKSRLSSLNSGEVVLENSFANAEANRIFASMELNPQDHQLWLKLKVSASTLSRQFQINALEHQRLFKGLKEIHLKSGCKEKHK